MGLFHDIVGVAVGITTAVVGGVADAASTVCDLNNNNSSSCESARDISDASKAQDALDAMKKDDD